MGIKKIIAFGTLLSVVFAVGTMVGMQAHTVEAAPAQGAQIYELRTYVTNDGKLDDLHARFSNHTNHIFVKHGMKLVGYWTHAEGDHTNDTLVYMIAHESREAAKANWAGFGADEEWKKVYAASRADGPLVKDITSVFLNPTDYSPMR